MACSTYSRTADVCAGPWSVSDSVMMTVNLMWFFWGGEKYKGVRKKQMTQEQRIGQDVNSL